MSLKKTLILSIICLVVAIVTVLFFYKKSLIANFEDEEMRNIITSAAMCEGIIDNKDNFTKNHFKDIKEVNIGYIGKCNSLLDLLQCNNLENLTIGAKRGYTHYYYGDLSEEVVPLNDNEINKFQEELMSILSNCTKIKMLKIVNTNNSCAFNNLRFLMASGNIDSIKIEQINQVDYSPVFSIKSITSLYIKNCDLENLDGIENLTNLLRLNLDDTKVKTADSIIELTNLNELSIVGTPLADNQEEVKRIYEKFPNIIIKTE